MKVLIVMNRPDVGALVISLDFELHWGVSDAYSTEGKYRQNLLGARAAIPKILKVFEEFQIAATWAIVGYLLATSKKELINYAPSVKPAYLNPVLSTDYEPIGDGEEDDPFHYAPSLIQRIRQTPRQEIGTHTFSHYYCLEPGQDRDTFAADLNSMFAIGRARGITVKSIVFPRNQYNPEYDDLLVQYGITCYRGTQRAWMYRAATDSETNIAKRSARLLNAYLNISGLNTAKWADIRQENGLYNVPAGFFVRPYSPRWKHLQRFHLQRIARSIKQAALAKEIVHLWWHPHNFGTYIDENIAWLRDILHIFARYRERHGLCSLSMGDVAVMMSEGTCKTGE